MICLVQENDSYYVSQYLESIRKTHAPEVQKEEIFRYYYEWGMMQQIVDDANTPSLFTPKKVLVVKDLLFLSTEKKPVKTQAYDTAEEMIQSEKDILEEYIDHPNPDTVLVILMQDVSVKTSKIVTKLKKKAQVYGSKSSLNDRKNAFNGATTIRENCASYQLEVRKDAMQYLCDLYQSNISLWHQELPKLLAHGGPVTLDTVKELCHKPLFGTGEYDLLNFCEAILRKDMKNAFSMWQEIKELMSMQGKNTVTVFSLIPLVSSRFRQWSQVKQLQMEGYSDSEIAKELGVKSSYAVEKVSGIIQSLSLSQIQTALHKLSDLDYETKLGKIDPMEGFELFLLETTRR